MNAGQLDRGTFEPGKDGRPGLHLRITVGHLVSRPAEGAPADQLLAEYPDLEVEDIRQALAYAGWLANDRVIGV